MLVNGASSKAHKSVGTALDRKTFHVNATFVLLRRRPNMEITLEIYLAVQ